MQPEIKQRLAVVVREGLKGNHLLFAERDLQAAFGDREDVALERDGRVVIDAATAAELAKAGIELLQAASIEDARGRIEAFSPACRAALARLYLRFLARCVAARGHAN